MTHPNEKPPVAVSVKAGADLDEIWDAATNSVCQQMQERNMCNCPDGDCLAAKVSPEPEDRAHFLSSIIPATKGGETWQPIETAPKDGTEIILYGPPVVYEGKRYPERVTSGAWCEWADTEECEGGATWASWDGGFREESPPTHWQPLPSNSPAALSQGTDTEVKP